MPVNEINNDYVQEYVDFNDSALAHEMKTEVDKVVKALEKAASSMASSKSYLSGWNGETRSAHDDFTYFMSKFENDIKEGIHLYQDAINVFSSELDELASSSTVINKYKSVKEI